MEFIEFKNAVAAQFKKMCSYPMYRTGVSKDNLWDTYLQSFPEGSNPIYRERTEHDCNCCKQFIRAVGNVVAIIDDKVVTIWDITAYVDKAYAAVASAMAAAVKAHAITEPFLHYEKTAGTDKNFQDTIDGVKTWNHFFVNIPMASVVKGEMLATMIGRAKSTHEVFSRAFRELTIASIESVLELIAQNSLYRGMDHKDTLTTFLTLKQKFDAASEKDVFVWLAQASLSPAVTNIRNTSIGTLLVDLSEGRDLEDAVRAFEAMVAPANYKRPKALVTQAMIDRAKKDIEELGLTSALQRRYATLSDITVNNSLFVNRETTAAIKGDVFAEIAPVDKPKYNAVERISIEDFIANVLPKTTSLEVFLENKHSTNMVSLITAADPTSNKLLKWDNPFSWSYNGDVTDSIKERVKAAGGNVTGELCCRLAWHNTDDLDLHLKEPNGYHIYFSNRRQFSSMGGMLDLDANGLDGIRNDPAENIFYATTKDMKEGVYTLTVNQYNQRSMKDVGFEAEIDFKGEVHRFSYPQAVRGGVTVATFRYSKTEGIKIVDGLPPTTAVKDVWGLKTQGFHQVNVMMLSPNYWEDCAEEEVAGIGNKHYFFMLNGCQNDSSARGLYNEFLRNDLNQHRKVIEMVGAKLRTDESSQQLSGLGFSSTQRNELRCRITGAITREIIITF